MANLPSGPGYAPAPTTQLTTQPGYLAPPPTAQATYYGGTADPSQVIQQILQGFAPQAQSAQNSLNATLAESGLAGGPNVSAQEQLQGQEAAGLAPSIANAIQFAQGQQQQAGLSNTAAANQFTLQNLQDLMGTNQYNTTAYNQQLNNLLGLFSNPYQQAQQGAIGIANQQAGNFPIQQGAGAGSAAFGQGLGQIGSLFKTTPSSPNGGIGADQ